MAQWRKVLVSGSAAHVSSVEVGTADGTAGTIINNSSIAGSRITGSFTGSYTGDGSLLTGVTATGLDIDNFGSDLTSATLAVSDLILVSDGGTDGRANIGDLATPLAGTGLEANSNTIRIAAAAAGDGLSGGAGNALALDLNELTAATVDVANDSIAIIDANDSNGSKKETVADLVSGIASTGLDASSGTLSVDVSDFMSGGVDNRVLTATGTDAFQGESNLTFDGSTLGVTGAVTATSSGSFAHVSATGDITASKFYGDGSNLTGVQQDIDSLTELDATPSLTEDEFLISDDGTEKRISMQNVANGVFQDVAGVVTVAAGGTSTLDLNSLGAAAVAVGADSIAIIDADDNTTKKEAVADVITAIAGAGTTATSGVLNVIGGDGITANANDIAVTAAQTTITSVLNSSLTVGRDSDNVADFATDNVVKLKTDGTERLRADNAGVDVTGALTVSSNATVEGNLVVNGSTTTISSTNLKVADRFIFSATGSAASNVDGGIIVQSGSTDLVGSSIYHDTSAQRWSVAKAVAHDATAVTPLESVVTVKELGDNDAPVDGDKEYGVGEMAINSNGSIWIYS